MKSSQKIFVLVLAGLTFFFEGCSKSEEDVTNIQFLITDYVTGQPIPHAEVYRAECRGDDCTLISEALHSNDNGFVEIYSVSEYDDFEIRARGYHPLLKSRYYHGYRMNMETPQLREYQMLPEASIKLRIIGNPYEEEIEAYALAGCFFKEACEYCGFQKPGDPCLNQNDGFSDSSGYNGWLDLGWGPSEPPPNYDVKADTELSVFAIGDTYIHLKVWLKNHEVPWRLVSKVISKVVYISRNTETEITIDLSEYKM
ncbi:hypothetical protein [Robiginitalea sp. SC105]|uniref:hypothetical protein n=1 Tax=Robiginitalea sp. SC105 TaxID=2762332 RepID=UPI00163A54F5|nr:hypothetical protein [Robiginitalea sp. SC105]MBC2840093.1 hypothetical protein [Robiginitalea sp. SC105]